MRNLAGFAVVFCAVIAKIYAVNFKRFEYKWFFIKTLCFIETFCFTETSCFIETFCFRVVKINCEHDFLKSRFFAKFALA